MSQSDGPRTPPRTEASGVQLGTRDAALPPGPAAPAPGTSNVPDVVLIHGTTEDKKGLRVLRAREQGIELGEVRPIQEGKPLSGEVVKLRPRPGMPQVCDVETQLSREELDRARGAPTRQLGHPGPARVTSEAYRTNWDAIYRSPGALSGGELN